MSTVPINVSTKFNKYNFNQVIESFVSTISTDWEEERGREREAGRQDV